MDVFAAVSSYVTKMVTIDESGTGVSSGKMKILLLDEETVSRGAIGSHLADTSGAHNFINYYKISAKSARDLSCRVCEIHIMTPLTLIVE
jgi:hypothetical protein